MFYQPRHPLDDSQSMNMDNVIGEMLHRLANVEMQLSVLLSQTGAPQGFYKVPPQTMFVRPVQRHNYFKTSDLFDTETVKTQIEPLVTPDDCPTHKHPIRKNVNHLLTMYIMDSVENMVYIVGGDKIYATTKFSTLLPITKSNYKDIGLHHVFVEVFDKLMELEKTQWNLNNNADNVIDDVKILTSILALTRQEIISRASIATLYGSYRWYSSFKANAKLTPSFKEDLVKHQADLRKVKERTRGIVCALKNLEQAFRSLLPSDGTVDHSDVKQTTIHMTIGTLKSLLDVNDE